MGYFKRPIRRRAARASADAFRDASREVAADARRWRRRDPAFVRFVLETPDRGRVGLFQTSDLIEDDEALPLAARSALAAAYRWFNANIPMPPRQRPDAVYWFLESAREPIARLRTIVECHRLAGRPIVMLATRTPGRIVYRDAVQVAAVPYPDRRRTSSHW